MYLDILQRINTFEGVGSGWVWYNMIHLDIHIALINPLQAGSYIHLLDKFQNAAFAKCIVNVENTDQQCFRYAVLAALHPEKKDPKKVESWIGHEDELDMTGISYPVR